MTLLVATAVYKRVPRSQLTPGIRDSIKAFAISRAGSRGRGLLLLTAAGRSAPKLPRARPSPMVSAHGTDLQKLSGDGLATDVVDEAVDAIAIAAWGVVVVFPSFSFSFSSFDRSRSRTASGKLQEEHCVITLN